MRTPTRAELREWTAALTLGPIDVGDPAETRYVERGGPDPVEELRATIELALDTTTQLFTGPAGAGRSTELRRLRRDLEVAGFEAVVVPVMDYLNGSFDVTLPEFLIALALGARDVLGRPDDELPDVVGMLRELVAGPGAGPTTTSSRTTIELPALGNAVDLATELRSSRAFVEALRAALALRLDGLHAMVRQVLRALLRREDCEGSVLLVDGLAVRGISTVDGGLQRSVEALFVQHASQLRFATHHIVYAAPMALHFTPPRALHYDGRAHLPIPDVAHSRAALREVVARRVPVDAILPDEKALDAVVDASGGHLRDLLRIVQELLRLVLRGGLTLPVGAGDVEEAIAAVARDFAMVTREQAELLAEVGRAGFRPTSDQLPLLVGLVQSRLLLAHADGTDWFEVHPLARRALRMP